MTSKLTKQETIDAIVKVAKKLDKLELQILLTKLRVKKMRRDGIQSAAGFDSTKIKPATMQQIDKWKHESRRLYAGK